MGEDSLQERQSPRDMLAYAVLKLTAAILDAEDRERWINDDPTPQCMDYSDSTNAQYLLFVDGKLHGRRARQIRRHILKCGRCGYLVGQIAAVLEKY